MPDGRRSYKLISRREFIGLLVGGTALATAGFATEPFGPFDANASGTSFPLGHRPVRLRALVENSAWTAPNHTAQDFIGWVQDLRPDTLVRFFSGPQDGSLPLAQVSGYPNPNETMTVLGFIQNCLNACANVTQTTLFPRLNMNVYRSQGLSTFVQDAQSIWAIASRLSPPQTLLSLDNWDDDEYTDGEATDIITALQSVGFQGFSCGPNAAQDVPNGLATFALFDQPDNAFTHFEATLTQQPSIMKGLRQIDFPAGIGGFAQQAPDTQADKITSFFQENQGQIGSVPYYFVPYVYWSNINAADEPMCPCNLVYDTTQIFTSPSGAYGGKSLYEITKELMNQYNPIPLPRTSASSSSAVSSSMSSDSLTSSSMSSTTSSSSSVSTSMFSPTTSGYSTSSSSSTLTSVSSTTTSSASLSTSTFSSAQVPSSSVSTPSMFATASSSMSSSALSTYSTFSSGSSISSTISSGTLLTPSQSLFETTSSEVLPNVPFVIPWLDGFELVLSILGGLGIIALRRRKRRAETCNRLKEETG